MQVYNKEWTNKISKLNEGKNKKYYILTMGCQLNENDSEKIAGMLEEAGYNKTDNEKQADIIILNTCCVRENAEDKLFGKLGEVKILKETKGTIVAIGGCMMQEINMLNRIKKSYSFVDIIFGTHTLEQLPKDLYEVIINRKNIEDVIDIDGDIYEGVPIKREDKVKASVTIMNGCNNFCTYCIVPYVRGRERSRNPQKIIDEIQELANEGYKEITLLGQNVNSYLVSEREKNNDLSYEIKINEETVIVNSFATLLIAVNKINGIEKIKFISPHPKDFTEDVINAIKNCEKVSKMIHLPLQSGSTEVLRRMNRKYSKEQYLQLVEKIKNEIPEINLSTDIIVGFPGETENDFEDTLDVVRKVNFDQIFMFIYSIREGTPGAKMEEQIEEKIKHERFERLKELYEKMTQENNEKYIGTTIKILVEGNSKTNENTLTGRTESNKTVVFEGNQDLIGKVVNVQITENHVWYLKGIII